MTNNIAIGIDIEGARLVEPESCYKVKNIRR